MGYMHIQNLYREQKILLFRECYALEKVHGTSAHISWNEGRLGFFSGGESYEKFVALFDQDKLKAGFESLGRPKVVIYGEAYGGKCQGMKETYGAELRFIAFDVMIDDNWLDVPNMDQVATRLGIEVVPWVKVATDLIALDAERDKPSEVAQRRGCGNDKAREGVVLRPLIEFVTNNDERVIVKHKGEKFSERTTPQKVIDPEKLAILAAADAIAFEWATEMRLKHVLDKLLRDERPGIEHMGVLIKAMVDDIYREAAGEIVESKEAASAIGKKTAQMFKKHLNAR